MKTKNVFILKNKSLKISILSILLTSFFILTSCSSDEVCEVTTTDPFKCDFEDNIQEFNGFTVVTKKACDDTNNVGFIYDTSLNSTATPGDDWGASISKITPANWTGGNLGNIFGIAIDHNQNIYLASTDLYPNLGGNCPGPAQGASNTNPGRIYIASPPSYNATTFTDLPNSGGSLNGIGNIAFDKKNKQLFATNLEDGKIYRIDIPSGSILNTYDPWVADVSGSGITNQDERVWAIGVNYEGNNVKLYFPRISSTERSIYSITLDNTGDFPASGSEIIEISNVLGTQEQITDIAFSSSKNKMLISEKGDFHNSRVLSYNLSGTSWNLNFDYAIGNYSTGKNSAGGVDFYNSEINGNINAGCDDKLWATGHAMGSNVAPGPSGWIYGITGIDYSGNNIVNVLTTDIYVDYDQNYGNNNNKGNLGDVETFDSQDCFCE